MLLLIDLTGELTNTFIIKLLLTYKTSLRNKQLQSFTNWHNTIQFGGQDTPSFAVQNTARWWEEMKNQMFVLQ